MPFSSSFTLNQGFLSSFGIAPYLPTCARVCMWRAFVPTYPRPRRGRRLQVPTYPQRSNALSLQTHHPVDRYSEILSLFQLAPFERACPFLNGFRRVPLQKKPDRFPSPFSSQQRARWTAASLRTGDLGLTIRAVLLQIFASSAVMRRIHEKTTFQAVEKSTLHRSMPSIASAAPSSP